MRGREGRLTFAAVCGAVAVVAACAATQAVALDACPDAPQPRVLASGQGTLESVGVDRKGRIFFTDLDGPGRLLRSLHVVAPRLRRYKRGHEADHLYHPAAARHRRMR